MDDGDLLVSIGHHITSVLNGKVLQNAVNRGEPAILVSIPDKDGLSNFYCISLHQMSTYISGT